MVSLLFRFVKIALVLCLPFIALIRGAVFFHERYDIGAYPSLMGGILLMIIVLVLYMTFFYERIFNRIGGVKAFKNRGLFALAILSGFCIQGLFFISSSNMKNDEISSEIRDLHPISRIALSTIIFVDKDLIITDTRRHPEDYRKMGLASKKSSLHFRQKDGYVYALDLRTGRRSEVRNILLRTYFRMMGFKTLRHGGTGDHLHVSLKCHFRPLAK